MKWTIWHNATGAIIGTITVVQVLETVLPMKAEDSFVYLAHHQPNQLEMQRLTDQKELRAKLLAEKESHEKDMQEKAIQLEIERRNKAYADRLLLEKEFIAKKFELLQSQLEEEEESKSVRSRNSAGRNASRVREWINPQPAVTVGANTVVLHSTGLTSHAVSSATKTTPDGTFLQPVTTTENSFHMEYLPQLFSHLISPVTMANNVLSTILST